jgi:hypothetical protein
VWQAVLILFAMTLLNLPFLKLVGALLLLLVWSEVKLLAPDDNDHGNAQDSDRLLADNKTSLVADLVMRVDNLIAIAGTAQNAGEHSAAGGAGPADLSCHHRGRRPAGDQAHGALPFLDHAAVARALLALALGKALAARKPPLKAA